VIETLNTIFLMLETRKNGVLVTVVGGVKHMGDPEFASDFNAGSLWSLWSLLKRKSYTSRHFMLPLPPHVPSSYMIFPKRGVQSDTSDPAFKIMGLAGHGDPPIATYPVTHEGFRHFHGDPRGVSAIFAQRR
jgi:hypothetical protein